MATKNGGAIPSLQYCEYLNISVCPASEAADSVSLIASPSIACNNNYSGNNLYIARLACMHVPYSAKFSRGLIFADIVG